MLHVGTLDEGNELKKMTCAVGRRHPPASTHRQLEQIPENEHRKRIMKSQLFNVCRREMRETMDQKTGSRNKTSSTEEVSRGGTFFTVIYVISKHQINKSDVSIK